MWKDLHVALRGFRRQPSFAAILIFTLALGIGGSTAIFSVVNAVLLRDLPYPDAGQLYLARSVAPDGSPTGGISPPELRPFYETDGHPVVEAAALAWSQEVQIVGADNRPYATRRYGVTDQFFEVFGTRMALGEPFKRGQPPGPIVLSHAAWRDFFGADPEIIGRVVSAEGIPRTVVGVTPAGFTFPENPGYWYLMQLGTAYDRIRGYRGFVRLRPGRTEAQFQAELTRVSGEVGVDPATGEASRLVAQPFLHYVVGDLRDTVTIIFGATAILLLIACINVTNLLLSRVASRSREMAVREAVGAGRWRVVRLLLTESLLISAVGGVLGFGIAVVGSRLLLQLAPAGLPRLDDVPIDRTVLLFALGVTVATGLLVGLMPAWRLARNQLRSLINESGRGMPEGPARNRLFSVLVVTEVALAVLLVIGAGLLVRSYVALTTTNPGFDPERVVTFFMNVPGRTEMSVTQGADGRPVLRGSYQPVADFLRDLRERIARLPGVEGVAGTSSLPLASTQYDPEPALRFLDRPGGASDAAQSAWTRSVSPEFFEVMGIRRLAGRGLLPSDRQGAPGVAVVNQTFARRFFADQDPVGQRVRFVENPWVPGDVGFQLAHLTVDEVEVVGVVDDVRYLALGDPPEPSMYLSNEQWTTRRQTIVVRTAGDNAEALVEAIRREIDSIDPQLSAQFALYPPIVRASIASQRTGTTLLVVFGLAALGLAAVGVYGLMSYSVTQRTGEIAVRSAMGASDRQVLGLIMRRGVGLAGSGVLIGLVGAVALRQVIASQLHGVTALDPRVFVLASLAVCGVAIVACYVPARRATKIQPAELLRTD